MSGPAFVVINRSNEHRPTKPVSNEIYLFHSLNDNDSVLMNVYSVTYRAKTIHNIHLALHVSIYDIKYIEIIETKAFAFQSIIWVLSLKI